MPAHRERLSSVNYGGPALVTNGDYLTIRANPLENTLVLWKFEKGKRSSVTWIRNTPDAHPSLFFPAMLHTDSIITAAGLPRMSFQAGLLDVAAYFAIVRLLGPCSVGAVYKKHQQDGKGSHDDLLSLCCDDEHYCVGIWRPPTIPSHVRLRQPLRTKSNGGPQLMEQYWCNLENLAAPFLSRGRQSETGGVELWQ
jgi:hypothetical protein